MAFLNLQPIRRQVVVATCMLLLPLAIAVAWSADRTRRERESELREQAGSIAITATAYLSQYLSGVDSMASVLTRHPDVVALDHASDKLFAELLRDQPLILNIVLTDRQGVVKATGLAMPAPAPQVVRFPYVASVVATRAPVVSELTTGQVSGKPTIVLAYPVLAADGSLVGVLGLGLNLARLQTVFSTIPLPDGSVITLTDSTSRVLARSLDPERYIGTIVTADPALPRDVPASRTTRSTLDGLERVYGNAAIDRGPWLLSVGIPRSVAVARLAGLWRRNLAISVTGIGAGLLLSLWFSTLLSRHLNRLRSAVRRIAEGDLSPPVKSPVPSLELAQLQDAFITMAANLRAAHEALDRQVEEERKIRETLQSLQRQVVRQERLAAVGLLVSGVAHELNNPLQAILGTAELLERDPELKPRALEEIAFVKTQSGRAREIIRNLSRFSSQHSGPPSFIDLREVINEVIQLRRRDLDNASIALDVETSSIRKVYANFTEIEQVALNFVINAQQAIESSGRAKGHILIRLSDAGKKVQLEVLDDGPGVSPEDEPKLFQPFFTTKPVGKGTGLGLSVSYGIIDSYGGSIGYRNNEWGGATFFFELPGSDLPLSASADGRVAGTHTEHDRQAVLHRFVPPRI